MGWENRGKNRYFYRKRRIGKRVVSEYIGAGPAAEMIAMFDERNKDERRRLFLERQAQLEQILLIDGDLVTTEQMTRALTRAALLLAGYHPHSRTWRKRRDE